MSEKVKCCYVGPMHIEGIGKRPTRCALNGKVNRGGKWYCNYHDPVRKAIEAAEKTYRAAAVKLAESIGLDGHRECPACGYLNGTAHGPGCLCVEFAAARAALVRQKGEKP